uniref:Uncharacterized protein n=1 Tax=Heterosigma akashiwo TaxID=2829 RepID=A0A7S3Y3T2_HETAK
MRPGERERKMVPNGSRRFEMQSKNSSLLQLLEKTQKAHPEQVRTSKHQKSFSGPLDAETLLRRTVVNVSPPVTKSEDTSKHNQLFGSETVQDTKSTHKKLFASTSDLEACTTFVRTGLAVPVSGNIQSGSAARVSSCPDISVVAATANPCDDTMIQDELQHLRQSNSVLARARSPDLQPGGKLRTLLEQEIARAAAEAKATSINSSGSQSDDLRTQLKEEKDWACPPADMQQCQELLNQEGEPTLQVKKSVTEEESITKTGKEEMANHLSNADIPDAHGGDINDPPRNILQLLNRRRQKGGDVW